MDERAFAARLVTYADALAAVSFVGAAGIANALMDPDVRGTLIEAYRQVAVGLLTFAAIASVLLITLRRWELDLLEGKSVSKKAESYSRRLNLARHAVVWLPALAVVGFMIAAT